MSLISKIIVSDKWKINDTTFKFFVGYLNEDIIRPLCIILPQMSGFIVCFFLKKNMSFTAEDNDVYSKYSEIWNKIKKVLDLKFSTNPIRDEKYITTKVEIFNRVNKTTFSHDEIPKEKNHYVCIAAINVVSVMKIKKKLYPQVSLEQCKYKLKKRKPVDIFKDEIELSSNSDYDDDDVVNSQWFISFLYEKCRKQ